MFLGGPGGAPEASGQPRPAPCGLSASRAGGGRAREDLLAGALSGAQFAQHLKIAHGAAGETRAARPGRRDHGGGAERARRDAFEIYGLDVVLDELPAVAHRGERAAQPATHGSAIKEEILGSMLGGAVEVVVESKSRLQEVVGGWRCRARRRADGEGARAAPEAARRLLS